MSALKLEHRIGLIENGDLEELIEPLKNKPGAAKVFDESTDDQMAFAINIAIASLSIDPL